MISRRVAGLSIERRNVTGRPRALRMTRSQSPGVRERPASYGSIRLPSGAPRMKWPGSPIPNSGSPSRHPNLELQHPERDREALVKTEHVGQVGVPWLPRVAGRAVQLEFAVHHPVQALEDRGDLLRCPDPRLRPGGGADRRGERAAHVLCQRVQLVDQAAWRGARVGLGGNAGTRSSQVDERIGPRDELGKGRSQGRRFRRGAPFSWRQFGHLPMVGEVAASVAVRWP